MITLRMPPAEWIGQLDAAGLIVGLLAALLAAAIAGALWWWFGRSEE